MTSAQPEQPKGELPPVPLTAEHVPPPSAPPPRGPGIGCLAIGLGVAALMFWVGARWGGQLLGPRLLGQGEPTTQATMPAGADDQHDHGAEAAAKQLWTCGMHPWVILPAPGLCPICHMQLVPVKPGQRSGQIKIDPVITQNIGVRIAAVTTGPLTRTIRTVGAIDYDETTVRDVNLKIAGFVEKLHIDKLGMSVEKGQPLLELYSPDLYSAQEEYLQAWRGQAGKTAGSSPASTLVSGWRNDLLEAARKRLEYLDITAAQIKNLEQSGKAAKTMTLRSPYAGQVVAKNVLEGQKVEAGMELFRVSDLSNVWVLVTVYESQLPFVQVGQKAVMSLPYLPGEKFDGKITFIYPYLNAELRQAKVRLEAPNPNGLLKPGMFANVDIHRTLAKDRVLVPREAVIDTGTRQVAFVSMGEGRFEPRTVTLGVEAGDDMVQVTDGLKPGEMVVTSGQFLLDSEANLREAMAKMTEGGRAASQPAEAALAAPASELKSLPGAAATQLNAIIEAYFAIGANLADDKLGDSADHARQIAASVDELLKVAMPDEHFWHRHTEAAQIRGKALELVGQKELPAARENFADLSNALGKLLSATGVPPSYPKEVQQLHCPMYREGQGGNIWLQPAGPVRNPFFGKGMLECFDKKLTLPKAGTGH
jgi:membrane fusion protein, copper/silver efflux system